MKRQYINPGTTVSAIDCAWYLMQALSSNVDLNNSGEQGDPSGALAPQKRVF